MKKIFNKYSLILGSVFFGGLTIYILSCADSSFGLLYLFNPEITKSDTYRPFYRDSQVALYDTSEFSTDSDCDVINAKEWEECFRNTISNDDLTYLLYKASIAEIDTILQRRKVERFPISDGLWQKIMLIRNGKVSVDDFFTYLLYAKKCQPVAVYGASNPWYYRIPDTNNDKNPRKDEAAIKGLITDGFAALSLAKNNFMRERYLFQITRLYFYSRQFALCYEFYQKHAADFSNGITKYRVMGFAAGSLYGLKQYAEANYLFSLIYDNCPPMRISAYYSFKPVEEKDWQQCLQLTKNTREKEVLWHLLGIYKDPLRAMKEIYSLDAKSDLLDVLVSRYINIAEETIWRFNNEALAPNKITYAPKQGVISDAAAEFIATVARNNNTNKPYLWSLVSSYISALHGKYNDALAIVSRFESSGENDVEINRQMKTIRLICAIESAPSITGAVEQKIIPDILYLNNHGPAKLWQGNPLEWVRNRLAERYKKQGDILKAELLNSKDRLFYDNYSNLKSMVAYMDKPVKSEFDKFYLGNYQYTRKSIYDYMAVKAFYDHDLNKAIKLYEEGNAAEKVQVKKEVLQEYYDSLANKYYSVNTFGGTELKGDPFIIHINDCHDCDHALPDKKTYTKIEFVRRLLALQKVVEKDPKNHVSECFELANGFYNATYWGNARHFYETDIAVYNADNAYFEAKQRSTLKELPINDCSRAIYYYKLALNNSSNNEFKAKCAFMLAKCEQNEFFMRKPKNFAGDFKAGQYFRLLREKYSKTNYYREVIRECGYFRTYVSHYSR